MNQFSYEVIWYMRTHWNSALPICVVILGVAAAVMLGGTAATSPFALLLVSGMVGPLVLLLAILSPRSFAYLLIAASQFNAFTLGTSLGNIRIDQVLAVVLMAGIVFRQMAVKYQTSEGDNLNMQIVLLLGVYVTANAVSSYFVSPDAASSLRIVAWLILSLVTLVCFIVLIGHVITAFEVLDALLMAGVASAVLGISLYSVHLVTGSTLGVQEAFITSDLRYSAAKGTFHEANIFGSYQAFTLVALFALLSQSGISAKRRRMLVVGLTISLVALILSFTRGAWLGAAVGTIALSTVTLKSRQTHLPWRQLALAAGGFSPLLILVGAPDILRERISTLFNDRSGTYDFRAEITNNALSEWTLSPIWGLGANSYSQYHPARPFEVENYLSTFFVATLFDSGVLGLCAVLAALIILIARLWGSAANATSSRKSAYSAAVLAGLVGLMVAYQATNAFWFSYNWIILATGVGIASSHRRLIMRSPVHPWEIETSAVSTVGPSRTSHLARR